MTATNSLDDDKLADYFAPIHFDTIIGPIAFGPDGEWAKPRIIYTQFQNVSGSDIGQFKDMSKQVVVWPNELKTGELVHPYEKAAK